MLRSRSAFFAVIIGFAASFIAPGAASAAPTVAASAAPIVAQTQGWEWGGKLAPTGWTVSVVLTPSGWEWGGASPTLTSPTE